MGLWRLASPKSAEWASRLETQGNWYCSSILKASRLESRELEFQVKSKGSLPSVGPGTASVPHEF